MGISIISYFLLKVADRFVQEFSYLLRLCPLDWRKKNCADIFLADFSALIHTWQLWIKYVINLPKISMHSNWNTTAPTKDYVIWNQCAWAMWQISELYFNVSVFSNPGNQVKILVEIQWSQDLRMSHNKAFFSSKVKSFDSVETYDYKYLSLNLFCFILILMGISH